MQYKHLDSIINREVRALSARKVNERFLP